MNATTSGIVIIEKAKKENRAPYGGLKFHKIAWRLIHDIRPRVIDGLHATDKTSNGKHLSIMVDASVRFAANQTLIA